MEKITANRITHSLYKAVGVCMVKASGERKQIYISFNGSCYEIEELSIRGTLDYCIGELSRMLNGRDVTVHGTITIIDMNKLFTSYLKEQNILLNLGLKQERLFLFSNIMTKVWLSGLKPSGLRCCLEEELTNTPKLMTDLQKAVVLSIIEQHSSYLSTPDYV